MHFLWICYDLSTEKLHYTTATLRYVTFLTHTVLLCLRIILAFLWYQNYLVLKRLDTIAF